MQKTTISHKFQRKFILFLSLAKFILLYSICANAQMTVTDASSLLYTPQSLISNVFLGSGVQITNISFSGDSTAIGYFNNGSTSVGINSGIVMTTGSVESSSGILGTTGCDKTGIDFASTDNLNFASDPDLATLTNISQHDLAVYTITFIPTSDTLRFRYCFGSEEWPEYACSPYNDIFGFFISGPNPSGGLYASKNIAAIPGTIFPVAINNIHPANPIYSCPAIYTQYYINNDLSNNEPSYDGLTRVFTAEVVVIPCQTYTIKLAIADISDGVFDSGVFLEANSFSTNSLQGYITSVQDSCNKCIGSATYNLTSGGTSSTYSWSPIPPSGQGTNHISGLCGNTTYTVTITNNISCAKLIDSVTIGTIGSTPTVTLNTSICNGNSYFFNGTNLIVSGTYKDTLYSASGCDTIVTLNLTVNPALSSTISTNICMGDSVLFYGTYLTTTGIYVDTVKGTGCDTIVTLNLAVNPPFTSTINTSICTGDSVLFYGTYLTTTSV